MKKYLLFGLFALLAGPLAAADADSKDDVINAAKKLAGEDNYSWQTSVTNVGGNGFRFGPTEGKITKDGTTWISMTRNDNTTRVVRQGGRTAVKTSNHGWQSLAEATEDDQGPGRFLGRMIQNFKAPAAQAGDLAAGAKEIKKDGDVYTGDLTEKSAQAMLVFRRPGGDDNGPTVSNAKGSMKFWIRDGELTKYEFNLQGTVSFNGNDRDINRTTTVEIKNVGSTRISIPDEARKKLSS